MIRQTKPLQAKNKKTYIAFVLDKSGSMETIREATISSFNEQLQEHRKHGSKGGETFLSLIQFSGQVEETFFNVPLDEIAGELDKEQYAPNGGTAMYDAIGYTLNKLQRWDEPGDVGFLVIVLSDGQENSSKKYDGRQISSLRKELEGTGRWTFQYIGCDAAAIKDAISQGFQSYSYSNTNEGMDILTKRMTANTTAYYGARSAGACSVANFMALTPEEPEEIDPQVP